MKTKLNMIGGGFQHDVCSSALNKNKLVEWVKNNSSNISIHIDNGIFSNIDSKKLNFGWLAESSAIIPQIINEVISNLDFYKFKYKNIFTHDERIIEIDPDFFKFTLPNSLPWIQNKKIYKKTKLCSSIISNKTLTDGHKFRQNSINKFDESVVDKFGRGTSNELPWTYNENGIEESGKLIALKDYYYSFSFENDNYNNIFCEKLTDCFATGTIPIYWGSKNIGKFFDTDGVIFYDENFTIDMINPDLYYSKIKSIENNFKLCLDLDTSEDYFYKNYIK